MGTTETTVARVRRDAGRSGRGAVARYSPWDDIGVRFPDWVVRVRRLDGPREVMCFRRRVILIDVGKGPAERRSSLAHAIAHIDLEHIACRLDLRAEIREERAADQLAAARLISLSALVDAIVWTADPLEACDELDVDLDTLRTRGAHLHPSERLTVQAALAEREATA